MTIDAIMIAFQDNVATAVRTLNESDAVMLSTGGDDLTITIKQEIPSGHKFAVREIKRGNPVIKYGEIIGLATENIAVGAHVHIHNVEGRKGRGDQQ